MLTDADVDRILDQVHEDGREISQTCRQMLHAFDDMMSCGKGLPSPNWLRGGLVHILQGCVKAF